MSVHFRDKCLVTNEVVCEVPCETKWSNRQPKLVMQGFASDIVIDEDKITIK